MLSRLRAPLLVGAACLFILAADPAAHAALSSKPDTTYVTDGTVTGVARTAKRIFISGFFSQVGPRTGPWVTISRTSGKFDPAMPQVSGGNGEVAAIIRDGAGGFYIGGNFTHVGGVPRNDVAHIRANKTVDPKWNPNVNVNGEVLALAKQGSTIYMGGDFSGPNSVNGNATRNAAAAVDATTGKVTSWDPDVNDQVLALAVSGSTVYLGGFFSTINGGAATRNNAAAVDATTGTDTGWNPDLNNEVRALAVSGSTVYLGGDFSGAHSVNGPAGPTRNYAAAVDATTANDTGWNPDLNNSVNALAVSGSTVYLGGLFHGAHSINGPTGPTRNYAAAVDTTAGTDKGWNPNFKFQVYTLAIAGSTVYVGGDFAGPNSVNGTLTRNFLAQVDATTGTATGWDPDPSYDTLAVAVSGSKVAAGGDFSTLRAKPRNNAAALNTSDGTVSAWNPNINGVVFALRLVGSTIYLGGFFHGPNSVNGNTLRNNAAAVDATTGAVKPWDPNVSSFVQALAVSGSTVYLGGAFNGTHSINGPTGPTRNYAAAVDATTGTDTGWDPNLSGRVSALAVSGSTVYLGGLFHGAHSINGPTGPTRNYAAAVDGTTAADTGWNPNLNNVVGAFAVSGSTVYLGGVFHGTNSVNANTLRNFAAAVDSTSGTVKPWDANPDNTVFSLAVAGSTVYVGGAFTHINGSLMRNRLAAVDATTATANGWDPGASNHINAIVPDGHGGVIVGGGFTTFDLAAQQSIAVFSARPANLVRPKVSGKGKVSHRLSCSNGTWAGSVPLTFAYRWLRNGSPIAGAVGTRYKLVGADAGRVLSCRVTARNLGGSASATSKGLKVKPQCVVPKLKGKKLGKAKKALRAADCKLGKVTFKTSAGKPARVISQKPKPGKVLRPHARVAVVLSKH